jgi:hypothetical protein
MEPAPIRYKNPGAMWGGNAVTKKWGEMGNVKLNDGLNQNNHIAVFPTYVQGICAQIDLWRTPRYRNKRFDAAIAVWSGGNWVQSYIKFVLDRVPGMTAGTIISDDFLSSPMGLKFLKAQAWHEAGKPYPAPDSDFVEAQRRVFGAKTPASTVKKAGGSVVAGGGVVVAAHQSGFSPALALIIGVAVAVGVFVIWKLTHKDAEAPTVNVNHGSAA